MKKTLIVLLVLSSFGLIPAKHAEASIFSDFVSSLKDLQVHLTDLVNVTKNVSSGDAAGCETKNCPAVKLNEINIPELGVKLSVLNGIKDLEYLVATTSATGTSKTILLSSETLSDLDDNCALAQAPLGTLSLTHYIASTVLATTTATTSAVATPNMKAGAVQVFKVGNKRLVYQSPQIYCSDNKLVQNLLAKELKNLQDSLKTLAPLSAASSTPATASSTEAISADASELSASVILSQTASSTATTTIGQ